MTHAIMMKDKNKETIGHQHTFLRMQLTDETTKGVRICFTFSRISAHDPPPSQAEEAEEASVGAGS